MLSDLLTTLALLDLELSDRFEPAPPVSRRATVIDRGYAARWRRWMNPVGVLPRLDVDPDATRVRRTMPREAAARWK